MLCLSSNSHSVLGTVQTEEGTVPALKSWWVASATLFSLYRLLLLLNPHSHGPCSLSAPVAPCWSIWGQCIAWAVAQHVPVQLLSPCMNPCSEFSIRYTGTRVWVAFLCRIFMNKLLPSLDLVCIYLLSILVGSEWELPAFYIYEQLFHQRR